MKDISELGVALNKFEDRIISKAKEAHENTVKEVLEEVLHNAPSRQGTYAESIKKSDTTFDGEKFTSYVYTDLKSEDGHFIGRMIENGTGIYALEPHIGHTKTFIKSEYKYWYVPVNSVNRPIGKKIVIDGTEFYVVHGQPSKPHFRPALDKSASIYKKNIQKAIEEAK